MSEESMSDARNAVLDCCHLLVDVKLNVKCRCQDNIPQNGSTIKDLDDNIGFILKLIVIVILYPAVGVFGVGTNIINIIIFVKHGLNDTVNITLVGLAVADMCSLLSLIMLGLSYNPLFVNSDIPFYASETSYLFAGMPRLCFSRIVSLILAFVTLERCLCVRFPLKVKTIITPRRAKIVLVCIFVSMILSLVPIYFSTQLGWKVYSERSNKTLLGLVYSSNRREIDKWTFALGTAFVTCSFLVVVICSLDLVSSLKRNQKWRQTSVQTTSCRRDARAGKMVLVLSLIFVISFIPLYAVQICMFAISQYNKGGDIPNIYHVTWSTGYFIEAIISSINIFVYYKMSSKYKTTFQTTFVNSLPVFKFDPLC